MRILVVAPHCDDAELSMGGTVARFVSEGHDVKILTAIIPHESLNGEQKLEGKRIRKEEQINLHLFLVLHTQAGE